MAVTDLTGTTWYFNSTLTWAPLSGIEYSISLSFNSNGVACTSMLLSANRQQTATTSITYTTNGSGNVGAFEAGGWTSDAYRTISITGGIYVTNATIISWLEANATQVTTSHDVTISYNNSTIAYLDASGTEILDTDGTYMADDITIEYTKPTPAAGSATTPATTITANPSISVSNSGLITATASATQSVTPTVVEGYVSSGTAGTITVSGSNTSQLTTQAATTYTPTTTNQTIASGKYLTGAQTILGDANLTAENIKKDVSIFGITGTYEGSGGGSTLDILIRCNNSTTSSWPTSTSDYEIISGTITDIFSKSQNNELIEGRLIRYNHNYDAEEGDSSDVTYMAVLCGISYSYGGSTFPGYGFLTLHFFDSYIKKNIRITVDDEQTLLGVNVSNF